MFKQIRNVLKMTNFIIMGRPLWWWMAVISIVSTTIGFMAGLIVAMVTHGT